MNKSSHTKLYIWFFSSHCEAIFCVMVGGTGEMAILLDCLFLGGCGGDGGCGISNGGNAVKVD